MHFFFGGGLAYKARRLVRYDIAAGIVPVSLLSKSHLFFCVQLLKKTIIPDSIVQDTSFLFLGGSG